MPSKNETKQVQRFQDCAIEWTPGNTGKCNACGQHSPLGPVNAVTPETRGGQRYADNYCQSCFRRLPARQVRTVAGR